MIKHVSKSMRSNSILFNDICKLFSALFIRIQKSVMFGNESNTQPHYILLDFNVHNGF